MEHLRHSRWKSVGVGDGEVVSLARVCISSLVFLGSCVARDVCAGEPLGSSSLSMLLVFIWLLLSLYMAVVDTFTVVELTAWKYMYV